MSKDVSSKDDQQARTDQGGGASSVLKMLLWPFMFVWRKLYDNWLSYVFGKVLRDDRRIYSVRFVWYGDSIYLHPMIWGSLLLFVVVKSSLFSPGWPLLIWFIILSICLLTVIYNFDIFKAVKLGISIAAIFGLAYISNSEWEWNPLGWVKGYIERLDINVSPGFYIASAWVFAFLISAEVIWAWLFNRVELDESYVYERRFLRGTSREPVFARGLKRETKDLLELLILGAGDIMHHTNKGIKRFTNVPGASLGLGKAIDSLLDHRRGSPEDMTEGHFDDSDQVMPSDAHPDDDGIHDDGMDDDMDDGF